MERIVELIRDAGDGAFAIDRQRRIVLWNEACERLFGYSMQEVLGRPCYEIIGGSTADGCLVCHRDCAMYHASLQHKPVLSRDIRSHTKQGEEIWLNVSTLSVPSSWLELSVLVHLVRDITSRKIIEKSLKQLVDNMAKLAKNEQRLPAKNNTRTFATPNLTRREQEVLRALATGATTCDISSRLSISSATTRNHVHNLLSKLGVHNRLEAVTLALRSGLI